MARLRAISRRGPVLQTPVLSVADITLNPATCEVQRGESPISLTRTEYLLLEFLMRRPSRVLSKAAIIAGVWSADKNVTENTLEAFIKLLDSPKRVIFEFEPVAITASHDSRKLAGDGRGGPPKA